MAVKRKADYRCPLLPLSRFLIRWVNSALKDGPFRLGYPLSLMLYRTVTSGDRTNTFNQVLSPSLLPLWAWTALSLKSGSINKILYIFTSFPTWKALMSMNAQEQSLRQENFKKKWKDVLAVNKKIASAFWREMDLQPKILQNWKWRWKVRVLLFDWNLIFPV